MFDLFLIVGGCGLSIVLEELSTMKVGPCSETTERNLLHLLFIS